MDGRKQMISPCVSLCSNVDGICDGCGRSMKDKFAWKEAAANNDNITLDRILLDSKERLTSKQYRNWQTLYEQKKQRNL